MVSQGDSRILAAIAIIALIMLAGFAALYSSVSSLEDRYAQVAEGLDRVSSQVDSLSRDLERVRAGVTVLASLQEELDSLGQRLSYIEAALDDVASAGDLESLAREISSIRVELETLKAQVEQLGVSSGEISSAIASLEERLVELENRVSELEDSILFPVVVVDGTGDDVVILEKPERIVSMAPSVTELIFYLGVLDRLVGVDKYSDWPPIVVEMREAGELANIGGFYTPSIEAILELQPDLVVGVASAPPHIEAKRILEGYGIPVILLPNSSIYDVAESAVILGRATGELIKGYEITIAIKMAAGYAIDLSRGLEEIPGVAIVWINPLFVVGSATWQHEILDIAGIENVYGDLEGWPMVSAESLLERAPSIIIMTGHNYGLTPEDLISYLEEQLGDAVQEIPAIAEGKIYMLGGDYGNIFNRPSPRTVLAIYVLLVVAHPDAFGVDPSSLPSIITPDNFNVIEILGDRIPPEVKAFLEVALSP